MRLDRARDVDRLLIGDVQCRLAPCLRGGPAHGSRQRRSSRPSDHSLVTPVAKTEDFVLPLSTQRLS